MEKEKWYAIVTNGDEEYEIEYFGEYDDFMDYLDTLAVDVIDVCDEENCFADVKEETNETI